ncbi:DUF2935 domain-containing protein [Haloplasma contractile]|uniref:DUF2935 domain-containing protein n=1 Tax=Haloplasma contractile SSD-17B TaxID=1033810 RepID=F7Q209_9MOLU|nr:DUF2935 domain-containing protein [Haloplasma contractile]ERJ12183.1 hypothetical protein HLPCO_001710 [Haloplasma contractile SSD-17B]
MYDLDIIKEIRFWTEIMRDHAEFQYTNLSPNETDVIKSAAYYMDLFKELHSEVGESNGQLSVEQVEGLISKNKIALMRFIEFKKTLMARLMKCEIKLGMPPSFVNHMINEAMEFYLVLCLADGTVSYDHTLENLRLHKIWLPDASGHASFIASDLDAVETSYIKEADEFVKKFDGLFKKAFEMYKMFERIGLNNGALRHFNSQVEHTLDDFICYLEKIEKLRKGCNVYGTGSLTPLAPGHMIREEQYYLYRVKALK